MYLLDTNVISELRRKKPHGAVLAWFETVNHYDLYIAAVTVGEIQAGIELTRKQDKAKAAELEEWLDDVVQTHQILPMDELAFRLWAKWMHGKLDTLYEDGMIATTAKVNNLIVVTRNVGDFMGFDVGVFDPFAYV